MNTKNLGGILDKINELRALFIFGQRVIPFLEELFYFVNDIVPVLEDINESIYESANKMPRASSQLNKVTQATELATTEILDNLDGVLSKLNAIGSHFQTATNDMAAIGSLDEQELKMLKASLNGSHKELLDKLAEIHEQKDAHLRALKSNAGGLQDSLQDIRNKSNDIMISLQVQDITTQQIASVNHLIQSVQDRLANLIDRFKISGAELVSEIQKVDGHTFDPQATYDRSGDAQRDADKVISSIENTTPAQPTSGMTASGHTSQDEIDKLFRKGA